MESRLGCEVAIGQAAFGGIWAGSGGVADATGVECRLFLEPAIGKGLGERRHQGRGGGEPDAVVAPDRLSAEADGQMRCPAAGWAEERQRVRSPSLAGADRGGRTPRQAPAAVFAGVER